MTIPALYTRSACRACETVPIDPLLDLGQFYLSDFVAPGQPDPPKAPLDVGICPVCDLVQLRHTVQRDRLYRQYWYRSGVNEAMIAELKDIAQAIYATAHVGPRDIVLDVGANDGTLLSFFTTPIKIAFEPAKNLYADLRPKVDVLYADYFPSASSRELQDHSVKAITSIAMFYDLDEPRAFVAEVDRLLTDDGVWIVQMQDLGQMVRATAFDNICHEHLCAYTPKTFANLLLGSRLAVSKVEPRAINGGSLRFTVTKKAQRVPLNTQYEVSRLELEQFASRVGEHRTQLQATVSRLLDQYQLIDLYGCSTKANTLLQYCGFDARCLRQGVERSPQKVGLETAGTRIPIVSEETWRKDPAPATFLGIWQFRDQVLKREHAYLDQGGSFLIPLPEVEVVCERLEGAAS